MSKQEYSVKEIEIELLSQLYNELHIEIGCEDNLLNVGLNSLNVMKIMSVWKKRGYVIHFSDLLRHPRLDAWAKIIADAEQKKKVNENMLQFSRLKTESDVDMYQPFDLTDVQYAYWFGRAKNQYLGNVGCHGYFEVNTRDLDLERLQEAWEILFEYHPMLRAKYLSSGQQVVMKKPYQDKLNVIDLSAISREEQNDFTTNYRERTSHRLLDIEKGQVITLEIFDFGNGQFRMCFEIDLLVCDVVSFRIILRDFAAYYGSGSIPPVEKEWNFAAYLQKIKETKKEEIKEAESYWKGILKDLPDCPRLPIINNFVIGKQVRFKRHEYRLSKEKTDVIRQRTAEFGTTMAAVMLTAYGYVLSKWSENKKFLINLPMFNRETDIGIDEVVADFTNLLLVPLDFTGKHSFYGFLKLADQNLKNSIDHSAYSGVRIIRELKRERDINTEVPFVFSCNLGGPLISSEFQNVFGDIGYMITQTPQVLLDFQLFDYEGGMQIVWDVVEQAFPNKMISEMFDTFTTLLNTLASTHDSWNDELLSYSSSQLLHRTAAEKFRPEIVRERTMTESILCIAKKWPDKTALINPLTDTKLSYEKLVAKARRLAGYLVKKGIQKKDNIILIADRNFTSVIAMLAIQLCGCAYVPVQVSQPRKRLEMILHSTKASFLVGTKEDAEEIGQFEGANWIDVFEGIHKGKMYENNAVTPKDIAYIIFTSGSTGVPKGVSISHQAAMNTIDTINQQYSVNEKDIAIGVSSYDFDLSVYDVFGLLASGGSLVIVPKKIWRDAASWVSIIEKYNVTIWNSVPALLKMLFTEIEFINTRLMSIRKVFLSGDWTGLDIPEKVNRLIPDAELTVMGGATEASIWSNYIDVKLPLPEEWKSIPYGKPLKNQWYRVVDQTGIDCPDYVKGELWIGGIGVADSYIGDTKLTEQKITEEFGKRWYHTGDLGCFWADGTIEFIGRMDNQVKIRGHRIELGEIEANIKECKEVEDCVVLAFENQGTHHLIAYFTQGEKGSNSIQQREKTLSYLRSIDQTDYDAERDMHFYEYCRSKRKEYLQKCLAEIDNSEKYVIDKFRNLIHLLREELKDDDILELEFVETNAIKLERFMAPYMEHFSEIVSGKLGRADMLVMDGFVSPGKISECTQGGKYAEKIFIETLKQMQKNTVKNEKKIRILEVGARSLETTYQILSVISNIEYTIIDPSKYYLNQAEEILVDFNCVEYIQDECEEITIFGLGMRSFDLIIANNMLHQMSNIPVVLKNLMGFLDTDGLLMFSEMAHKFPLADISIDFLSREYTDLRKETGTMILDKNEWEILLNEEGFCVEDILPKKEGYPLYVYCLANSRKSYEDSAKDIKAFLQTKIPSYMVPQYFCGLRTMYVTNNGKLDRKKLAKVFIKSQEEDEFGGEFSETEKRLAEIWKKVLGEKVYKNSNYFQLGGDSLLATQLSAEIRGNFGIDFSIELVFEKQTLSEMATYIDAALKKKMYKNSICLQTPEKVTGFIEDSEHKYDPFPLTDVQQAYWLGRNNVFRFGGKSTQCYFELECIDLDISMAQNVLNEMIKANDTLRQIVLSDGQRQRILPSVPEYKICIYDLSECKDKESIIAEIREEMSQKLYELEKWPLFDIRFIKVSVHKGYMGISFDNILMDGWSMFFMMKEWNYLYHHPEEKPHRCTISFRDYVLNYERIRNGGMHDHDWKYWMAKKEEIYPAPELAVCTDVKDMDGKFKRFSYKISESLWEKIKEKAKKYKITPAALLLSAYAEVIDRWSGNEKFSINLTNFNRVQFHPEVEYLMGDFTSLTIHSINMDSADNFARRTVVIQEKMWTDLSHSYVSGVEIERYLKQTNGLGMMPIVYTCGLGLEKGLSRNYDGYLGELKAGLSFTPQVWIDNQVSEDKGQLLISWDALVDIFPTNMVDEMFMAYTSFVECLGNSDDIWTTKNRCIVDVQNEELRLKLNDTRAQKTQTTLLRAFQISLQKGKEETAVIDTIESFTFGELNQLSNALARKLRNCSVTKGDIVAIWMPKGAKQIIAMLAIFKCGAIYLPLKYDNPLLRNRDIVERSQAKCIIANEFNGIIETNRKLDFNVPIITVENEYSIEEVGIEVQPDDIAYIIYTSGTTGIPKGVAITHRGAMNTIEDINRRLAVNSSDRTIAISDISFDLSVYDIFGMLSVGGCIVIPDFERQREPLQWLELIENFGITIWNSVPMYMQMFVEYLQGMKIRPHCKLRAILLSGDWIPIDLKNSIEEVLGEIKVYGLGGATEASIWSNIYEIGKIDSKWKSIPYGKPLKNQRYYIFDQNLLERPNNVPGNLYIAGDGLAISYWNDEDNTKKSFGYHPYTKERIYNTGDLALYMPDGNICFLGRNDGQVKINGFRIELDEIDCRIRQKTEISYSASVEKNGRIYTFITLLHEMDMDELYAELVPYLPEYMLPTKIIKVDAIPLSVNGKVDRKKLIDLVDENNLRQSDTTMLIKEELSDDEQNMMEIWQRILGLDLFNVNESFVTLGGDSLKAVKIINAISKKYGVEITLNDFYQNPSVSELVKFMKIKNSDVDMGEI